MNKIQIDCFIAAANSGSLTAAAKEMFLTQQSVSQNIRNLEKETGCTLFIRNKNGVTLTEDGHQFYAHAERWSGLYNGTVKKIDEYYSSISASFRIGITEYVDVLGNISSGLAAFREKHKDIAVTGIQCQNRDLLEQIERRELDVAIINDMQIISGGDIDYVPFAKEDLRLYISGYHPEKPAEEVTLEEVKDACIDIPHISTSYGVWETSDWEEVSHRMSTFLGYDFTRHFESVNFRSCILNLETIPCSVVCDARFGYISADTDIFNIPVKADSNLCILWHRKNENPLIREFTDHMTKFYQ